MAKINILYGSVYGGAEALAEEIGRWLTDQQHQTSVIESPQISDVTASDCLLVITSTTGQGDIPGNLEPFFYTLRDQFPLLNAKPFAVIGMGDSSYGDTFCGAGEKWFELLCELQGKAIRPLLRIDATETLEPADEAMPWLKEWVNEI